MQLKYCRQCNKNLPLKCFTKNKKIKDGHSSLCKYCISIKRKIHAPSISPKLDGIVSEAKDKKIVNPITIDCDYGDYTQTKLHNNFNFTSGDGGYKNYIDSKKK